MSAGVDSEVHDVMVVGAGPAGCALALSLSKCAPEVSFLLVSDAKPSIFKIGESLPPEATRILHHLHPSLPKVLAAQETQGLHVPSDGVASAWGSPELEERHSILNPFGHAWHLDRAAFDESLRKTVRESRGRESIQDGKFVNITKERDYWTVQIVDSDGTRHLHRARWIIDATGRKATVATKLGARTVKHDDLLAFYAVLSSASDEEDYDARTLIESTPSGWWYSSLLAHRRRVVVYHTDGSSHTAKLARRRPGFVDLLHEETSHISSIVQEYMYEVVEVPETHFPQCTAAGSSSLLPSGDEESRWFAVGDAAMAFDPLSAQGMMTALEMGFFVGRMLGARLTGRTVEGVVNLENLVPMGDVFERVKAEYEGKREYYYEAEKRFETEFWQKRRVP